MESFTAGSSNSTPLLDTIRRTIEERNLLTARSRLKYVSALRKAVLNDASNNLENTVAARIEKLKLKVIKELITSEKTYLKQVGWIVTEFKLTLEVHSALPRKDMDILFGNIELINTLNQEFYKELTTHQNVTETFKNFAPMLKIYSAYARNYQQAIETLQAISSRNPTASSIITEKEEKLKAKLSSLLIVPIQRIPRYKLLLEQLLSFSKKGETNLEIKGPLTTINEVAMHMNEMVRSFENSQKILEIQKYFKKKLKLELVQPGRMLIKNGIVHKPPKNHRRYLILFNDQIYFCKMKPGKKIRLHSPMVVPLRKCVVNLNQETIMIHFKGETPVAFTVSDPDERTEWHEVIADTIKNLKRRVATLRKESSNARPMLLSRGTPSIQPQETPGRLKRSMNISACLDEIVDFLSPKKKRRTAV